MTTADLSTKAIRAKNQAIYDKRQAIGNVRERLDVLVAILARPHAIFDLNVDAELIVNAVLATTHHPAYRPQPEPDVAEFLSLRTVGA